MFNANDVGNDETAYDDNTRTPYAKKLYKKKRIFYFYFEQFVKPAPKRSKALGMSIFRYVKQHSSNLSLEMNI